MPLAQDLMGTGVPAEEAIRDGDIFQYMTTFTGGAASTATTIGGPNGATLIEVNGSASAALTFLSTTERDRWYTIYNSGSNAMLIFCPIGSAFQFASNTSVATVSVGGVNYIVRIGPVPFPSGSVTSDRWIFK